MDNIKGQENSFSKKFKKREILILLPTYNEGEVISKVVKNIIKEGYKNILIVDDGSSDNTQNEITRIDDALYIKHLINCGKGSAIKTGVEAAKKIKPSYVITMDSDGQHDPGDISKLITGLREGYDVSLGSRFLKKTNIPMYKIILNKIGNNLTWLVCGLRISDSQCGLRAYSFSAINKINFKYNNYDYDSDIIREIKRKNLKYKEVPINVAYTKYSQTKPNKQNLKNGFKTLLKLIFSRND